MPEVPAPRRLPDRAGVGQGPGGPEAAEVPLTGPGADDRAALVRAVRAAPDDDAPRLVMADWFEERGDEANVARAEFIRTQIERAGADALDGRQSGLLARELRLLARYGKAWCGSHFVFKKARFRRGFIEYVHLHLTHFLHHRRPMFALEPVRDVSLTGWMRAKDDLVRRVAGCPEWRHVETLRIHHQGPHKSPQSNLIQLLESPHLTGLRALRVPMLSLTADARRRFERAPAVGRLSHLTLPPLDSYPHNPGEWFADGRPAWADLRTLRPRSYFARTDPLIACADMPFWHALRALDWQTRVGPAATLAALAGRVPSQLDRFRLIAEDRSHEPDWLPTGFFQALGRRPLRELHLEGVQNPAAFVGPLFGPGGGLRLAKLGLLECGLADADVRALATSAALNELRSLRFGDYPGPAPEAMAGLLGADWFRGLVELDLTRASLTPAVVEPLAANLGPHLRTLAVTCDGLTPAHFRRLFDPAVLPSLVRLSLGSWPATALAPEAAEALAALPHLSVLKLTGVSVAPEIRRHLRGAISWVTVHEEDLTTGPVEPSRLPPLDEDLTDLDQWG